MHIKEHYIKKHKLRENIRIKLDKALQHNAALRPKVARLSATKAALEMELTAVLADTGEIRQKRRDLEHAADRDRQRRQREAERALQIRLREEEWDSMMEEEKARSEIAAEARAKANHRVEAHSASLRKMLHAYQFYEPRHNNTSSSTQIDNNGSDHGDSEDGTSTSKTDTDDHASKPTQPFQMDFFLPPELAGFEEDGLCKDNEVSNVAEKKESCNSISSPNCANKMLQQALKDSTPFRWRIASFPDQDKFVETIINMVSDDEDN
ncbi:hypothetical protein PHYBOEH_009003 [Phytophthora boehmeriae]|uniref:Uncharacterized protein n=1 Tax=Phytophthora boehmeriae TaxID=109152 RepID=A0A8T1VWD2_9STRA|nr:hypothetical protein PHYBOEH_009003 [Phytophthora boehmeriae]